MGLASLDRYAILLTLRFLALRVSYKAVTKSASWAVINIHFQRLATGLTTLGRIPSLGVTLCVEVLRARMTQ
jgi:hypothetical protein